MFLQLQRDHYLPNVTLGMLSIDGVLKCYTLERPAMSFTTEIHCISSGTYSISLYESPHFKRLIPLLNDVPGRTAIEIHWGNYPEESKGCILVGHPRDINQGAVWNSKITFDDLFPLIEAAVNGEGCQIEITDGE